jgi:hypothetical protein
MLAPSAQLNPPPNATFVFEGLGFFQLKVDPTIAVLHVTTFSIRSKKSLWREALASIIDQFQASKCRKLIVDVTGNGGGYVDLAYELLAVLSPTPRGPFPMVDQRIMRDFRLSSLMKEMVGRAVKYQVVRTLFHPAWYGIPSTRKWYTDDKLIQPRKRAFGKNVYEYSDYYKEVPVSNTLINPLVNKKFSLTAKDIVLVGNGDCGSACGLFYHHLRELDRIPAAVTSYKSKQPRTFMSFPATEVYTLNQVISEGNKLGMTEDPLLPDPLLVQAVYRFPIREGYCRRKGMENIPIEYVRISADIKVDVNRNLMLRPDLIWERLSWQLKWIDELPEHHSFKMDDDLATPAVAVPPPSVALPPTAQPPAKEASEAPAPTVEPKQNGNDAPTTSRPAPAESQEAPVPTPAAGQPALAESHESNEGQAPTPPVTQPAPVEESQEAPAAGQVAPEESSEPQEAPFEEPEEFHAGEQPAEAPEQDEE